MIKSDYNILEFSRSPYSKCINHLSNENNFDVNNRLFEKTYNLHNNQTRVITTASISFSNCHQHQSSQQYKPGLSSCFSMNR